MVFSDGPDETGLETADQKGTGDGAHHDHVQPGSMVFYVQPRAAKVTLYPAYAAQAQRRLGLLAKQQPMRSEDGKDHELASGKPETFNQTIEASTVAMGPRPTSPSIVTETEQQNHNSSSSFHDNATAEGPDTQGGVAKERPPVTPDGGERELLPLVNSDVLMPIDTPNFPAELLSLPMLERPEVAKLLGQWIGQHASFQGPAPQQCCEPFSGLEPPEHVPSSQEGEVKSKGPQEEAEGSNVEDQKRHFMFSHQGRNG